MGQSASGAQLEERYFMQKVKLGQGSFGTVWRAVDRQSGNVVAVKQLDKASLPRRGVKRQDIDREIAMMRACEHENLTKLFDEFEDSTSIYLALEYCDGGDFGDKVKERGMNAEETEVKDWIRQMCAAVNALHGKSICHRDIKPDNFMVSSQADGSNKLKLTDFGLAIYLPQGQIINERCGTPAFMAPEQHNLPKKSRGYSLPVDVWAMGISMYMVMFGGRHPFVNGNNLDEKSLLSGDLDFRVSQTGRFFGLDFGVPELRLSDDARLLCSRMVEPEEQKRITAIDAMQVRWVNGGRPQPQGGGAAVVGEGAAAAPMRGQMPAAGHPPVDVDAPLIQRKTSGLPPSGGGGGGNNDATPHGGYRPQGAPFQNAAPRRPSTEIVSLQSENTNLKIQLEEQKSREQQLMEDMKKLSMLQKQRSSRSNPSGEGGGGGSGGVSGRGSVTPKGRWEDTDTTASSSLAGPIGGLLPIGAKCRYLSDKYGWIDTVVQSIHVAEKTYDLAHRPHAALDKIAPAKSAPGVDPWPPGTMVSYLSEQAGRWMDVTVKSFNDSDGTYNLCVRDHAEVDRIRARLNNCLYSQQSGEGSVASSAAERPPGQLCYELPSVETGGRGLPPPGAGDFRNVQGSPMAETGRRGSTPACAPHGWDGTPLRVRPVADPSPSSDATAPRAHEADDFTPAVSAAASNGGVVALPRLTEGMRCTLVDVGSVVVEAYNKHDGMYTVNTLASGSTQVSPEALRAPADSRFAWPAGLKVCYYSSSQGNCWVNATVNSFNTQDCKYDLDVRQGAAPDRIRPR